MPPMPPGGIGGVFSFSGISVTNASVVSNRPAMEAAFCSAVRVTLVGSTIPAFTRSLYSPVARFALASGRGRYSVQSATHATRGGTYEFLLQ
jgi:hypothetical protein